MNDRPPDDRSKRPATIIDQALHAADALVNEVQQRIPPELMSQLRAGQRRIDQRISKLQTQLGRSATRAEVDRLARRIDELAAQLEELARRGGRPPRAPRSERSERSERSGRGPQAERSGRGPQRSSTSSGSPQRSSTSSSGGPKRSSASGPQRDQSTRRSPRGTSRPEQGDGGAPRRTPRTRAHKPPEPPAG